MGDIRFRLAQRRLPLDQSLRTTQDLPRHPRRSRRRFRFSHVLGFDAYRPFPPRSSQSRLLPPSQARHIDPWSPCSVPLARLPPF